MIAVIDYKAGNLTSVVKALTALGAEARVTDDPAVVRAAERIVLPGGSGLAYHRRVSVSSKEKKQQVIVLGLVPRAAYSTDYRNCGLIRRETGNGRQAKRRTALESVSSPH